jgi:hypothetical protein
MKGVDNREKEVCTIEEKEEGERFIREAPTLQGSRERERRAHAHAHAYRYRYTHNLGTLNARYIRDSRTELTGNNPERKGPHALSGPSCPFWQRQPKPT